MVKLREGAPLFPSPYPTGNGPLCREFRAQAELYPSFLLVDGWRFVREPHCPHL